MPCGKTCREDRDDEWMGVSLARQPKADGLVLVRPPGGAVGRGPRSEDKRLCDPLGRLDGTAMRVWPRGRLLCTTAWTND